MEYKFPRNTFISLLEGVLNLMHIGAVLLGLLLLLGGFVSLFFFKSVAVICILLSILIFVTQVYTRIAHILEIQSIRKKGNAILIYHHKAGRNFNASEILSIEKKDFAYADPWRPITLGYPGIEINLKNESVPAEHLYPYGSEELRDRMYLYLDRYLHK